MRLLALLLLLLASGCVTGAYSADATDEPIERARIEALQPGHDTLATCLDALGAPNHVFEYRAAEDGKAGVVLLWFWSGTAGWGVQVSSPGDLPGTLGFKRKLARLPGCVLWFGPDFVLERVRAGDVTDMVPDRVRPAFVDG